MKRQVCNGRSSGLESPCSLELGRKDSGQDHWRDLRMPKVYPTHSQKASVLLSTTKSIRTIWGFQIPFSLGLGSQDLVRDTILGTLYVSKLGC